MDNFYIQTSAYFSIKFFLILLDHVELSFFHISYLIINYNVNLQFEILEVTRKPYYASGNMNCLNQTANYHCV